MIAEHFFIELTFHRFEGPSFTHLFLQYLKG